MVEWAEYTFYGIVLQTTSDIVSHELKEELLYHLEHDEPLKEVSVFLCMHILLTCFI